MATTRGPRIVNRGLILALDTADRKSYSGSGTAWNDLSGNGNNFTFITHWGATAPTFSASNGGYVVVYNANWFDTVYASATLSSSLKPTSITMEAWVYMGSTISPANETIISVQRGNAEDMSYGIKFIDGRFGIYIIGTTGGATAPDGSNPTITANTWFQTLGTYDGTTIRSYVNGIERSSANITGNISYNALNTKILIGAQYKGTVQGGTYDSGPSAWWGNAKPGRTLSIVRMYNRALTAAEALQNFQANRGRYGI